MRQILRAINAPGASDYAGKETYYDHVLSDTQDWFTVNFYIAWSTIVQESEQSEANFLEVVLPLAKGAGSVQNLSHFWASVGSC